MFCSISPLIFKLEKATIYQIKANVMRIQQNFTIFGYLNSSYRFGSQSTFFWYTPYFNNNKVDKNPWIGDQSSLLPVVDLMCNTWPRFQNGR